MTPQQLQEQITARLAMSGTLASEHSQQFNKILDLNYEMDRKTVSLVQSLGVREVTSRAGQTGIPLAAGTV